MLSSDIDCNEQRRAAALKLPSESDYNEQRTAAASGCLQTVNVTNSVMKQLQALF